MPFSTTGSGVTKEPMQGWRIIYIADMVCGSRRAKGGRGHHRLNGICWIKKLAEINPVLPAAKQAAGDGCFPPPRLPDAEPYSNSCSQALTENTIYAIGNTSLKPQVLLCSKCE
jgi:hypothetical protein